MKITSLVRGGSVQAHWMQDGSSFWYAEGAPDGTVIYKVDPKAPSERFFIDNHSSIARPPSTELMPERNDSPSPRRPG